VVTVAIQPGLTDWLTAVGTVAVAVVAVGVALYAERRADQRVTAEREHAAKVLADERSLADARLADERALADRRFLEERQRAQDGEQLAQAWAVEILPGSYSTEGRDTSAMTVLVSNLGVRTIARVEAQFSPDGHSLITHARTEHLRTQPSDVVWLRSRQRPPDGRLSAAYSGILTPGSRMRIWSDEIADQHLSAYFPVVRWSDWLGQRWENRRGAVRRVGEGDPWEP
jgi:hypothetical protein